MSPVWWVKPGIHETRRMVYERPVPRMLRMVGEQVVPAFSAMVAPINRILKAFVDVDRAFHARDVNVTHLGRYGPGRQI